MTAKKRNALKVEDFTLPLAIWDAIPVLLFLGSMLLVAGFFPSVFFLLGASLSCIAGMSKVVWKFIMAWKHKNCKLLSDLFVPFQCIGFLLMILSLILDRHLIVRSKVWKAISSFPVNLFFLIGILGMVGMIAMSYHFDQSIRAHKKAQGVNTIAQGCFFLGLLVLYMNK